MVSNLIVKMVIIYYTNNHLCVPQGSILGLLLFNIFINDLVTVSNKLNFLMYADDTTIYFNLKDFSRDDVVNCVN